MREEKLTLSNMIFRLELGKHAAPGINRPQNEDNLGYFFPQQPEVMLLRGQLFIIADGSGEQGLGDFASKLAIQTIIQEYYDEPWVGTIEEMLTKSFMRANRTLIDANIENRSTIRFSTSLTCGIIHHENLYLAHIGACTAFLYSSNIFETLTQSHSIDLEKGDISRDFQAEENGKILVRTVGINEDIKVDIIKRKLQINDIILLCTDGITNYVNEMEIQNIITSVPPQQASELLVEQAISNHTPDDATAMIVKVKSIKRVEADEQAAPAILDQSQPVERQVVIKGVRYRSTWNEDQLPEGGPESVAEFSQDREVRRPIMRRSTKPEWKATGSLRRIVNIITIIAFVALLAFLGIKYLPKYWQSKSDTTKSKVAADTLSQVDRSRLPIDQPKEEADVKIAIPSEIIEPEDTTEYLSLEEPAIATEIKLENIIVDGSFTKNVRWTNFINEMKKFSKTDQINTVKSSIRLQKSKILWRRTESAEKENAIKERVDQYQRLFAQYFKVTPELYPLDLTIVIGADFRLPQLPTSYRETQSGGNVDYYLEILNGFTVPGLARRLSELLNYRKIDDRQILVVDYRNADQKNYRISFFKCDPSRNGLAKELGDLLGQRLSVVNSQLFDIKLVVGTDIRF